MRRWRGKSSGRYVLVTGEVVASDWTDLTDGALTNGIDRTLSGEKIEGYPVWTSTQPDGAAWEDSLDCLNWSTKDPQEFARQGVSGHTDTTWTDDEVLTLCAAAGHLYCFEQE